MRPTNCHTPPAAPLRVAGLFAGIGGIELGLKASGHESTLLCEIDPGAQAVLRAHFGDHASVVSDVKSICSLPTDIDLLTAGFPCTDISQAGRTAGIKGAKSGLVGEVFRILEIRRKSGDRLIPWIVLENVPFMLSLANGEAMEVITTFLEHFGYKWAYRVVDSRAFGIPQRRRRVLVVACLDCDPRDVLLADEAEPLPAFSQATWKERANGFSWTEGNTGLGWADNAVPTLKAGSTVGIPSPPAIVRVGGDVMMPDIRDAERLQGFDADWTKPAESVVRASFRWKYVGNAVTVPLAKWLGERLRAPGSYEDSGDRCLERSGSWPMAAWNLSGNKDGRYESKASCWPVRLPYQDLETFLREPGRPLSLKAAQGFHSRLVKSVLRRPEGFDATIEKHIDKMRRARSKVT